MALTAEGLTLDRQPEILEALISAEQSNISPNINTRDDEVLGQLNQIFSLKLSEINQIIQAAFDNMNVETAEGIWLDKKASEKFLARQQESYSHTDYQKFTGDNGATIQPDTRLKSTVSGDEYKVTSLVTLDSSNCISITYRVNTVSNSTAYDIVVDTTSYTYTSDASATELEILNGLHALVVADVNARVTSSVDTVNKRITLTKKPERLTISSSASVNLSVQDVSAYGTIQAIVAGPLYSVANSITEFVASVPGVSSTTNTADVVIGRNKETDEELRNRIMQTNVPRSVATLDAIYGRLLDIPGVTDVRIVENPTATVDSEGRPPYSLECVVNGGQDLDVATEIWNTRAARTLLYGNTYSVIIDAQGNQKYIYYSRPTGVNVAFKITYSVYDEEVLTSDVSDVIKSSILGYIGGIGIDVIPPRYNVPIYNSTSGISVMTVQAQVITNPGDTPNAGSWATTKIAISPSQYASTTLNDIYITVA